LWRGAVSRAHQDGAIRPPPSRV